MKYLGFILVVVACYLTYQSLEKEGDELDYVMDSMSFLNSWNIDQDYEIACSNEGKERYDEGALEPQQINRLISKGLMACALDAQVGVPLHVGKALAEAAYIPARAAIPYELAKTALQNDEVNRCSDYVKPLILTCPQLLKPYFKRVEIIEPEE